MGQDGLARDGLKNSVKQLLAKKKKKNPVELFNKCNKLMGFNMNEKKNNNQSKNTSDP